MAFTVRFTDNSFQEYDNATFKIEGGVLSIGSSGPEWSEHYAPHAWRQVTAEPVGPGIH